MDLHCLQSHADDQIYDYKIKKKKFHLRYIEGLKIRGQTE